VRVGDRAFSVAAPRAWNRLPTELKLLRSTDLFRRDLKTVLFHWVNRHQDPSIHLRRLLSHSELEVVCDTLAHSARFFIVRWSSSTVSQHESLSSCLTYVRRLACPLSILLALPSHIPPHVHISQRIFAKLGINSWEACRRAVATAFSPFITNRRHSFVTPAITTVRWTNRPQRHTGVAVRLAWLVLPTDTKRSVCSVGRGCEMSYDEQMSDFTAELSHMREGWSILKDPVIFLPVCTRLRLFHGSHSGY